uniref:chitin synthase n=1 Tax=Manduca sexta TaxID=7130 RepID=Q530Z6_MANSE|nr:chitin synthase 2 [Manduca sexta]AAX20092.1 chitin synthase 2 [Manduca sexta]
MAATTPGFKKLADDSEDSDTEYTPLYDDGDEIDQRTAQETKGWNLFREIPVKKESGSMATKNWIETSVKIIKVLAYILVFCAVLGSAVIAKGTLLFITSQLKKDRQITHCNRRLALDQQFITVHSLEERITWLWAALIVFGVPELGVFLRSVRICFFKTAKKPTKTQFIIAFITETLQAIGIAALVLIILPELDAVKGAMLMNATCAIPALLNIFTRDRMDSKFSIKLILDVLAISAQATAFVVWPLMERTPVLWTIPVACVLVSLGFWENFVDTYNKSYVFTVLQELRDNLKRTRYYTQRVLSVWKIIVFMACILISLHMQNDNPFTFFTHASKAFGERQYVVNEVLIVVRDDETIGYDVTGGIFELDAIWTSALWVALIQVGAAYFCFGSGKFACKILIQNFSFTLALTLVGPVAINLLIAFCGMRNADPCAFHRTIPDNLFYEIPPVYFLREYVGHEMAWVWLLWLISQAWIVFHTWQPRCERLSATDKLFAKPWYIGPLIDQSLLLNRTKDLDNDCQVEDLKGLGDDSSVGSDLAIVKDIKPFDSITRIQVCATMWHETNEEMIEFLKSIFRLDEDQSARRVAQKYLGIVDPDYYELECHIFMDDAFEISDHSAEDSQVNRFVKCLVDAVDEAASEVHLTNVRLRPPKKYPTPYGGKLIWTMPGKNKLICHLKDKSKIRHRKRWSQVMYMYYFLGHRLMDLPISVDRKEVIAENTYLLALDGDIDFKPSAVTLLVDLMKKDKNLGAACGRIHPVGSGFMAWYQMFEYAIGHWLQKATEHMIGCVLCSPGCFSLFRGKALMDDNVMKKYTLTSNEARHYVQYDQGEDRWLCTLLLQRGYRVEYSAASDAYTHCPERFDEFFNQRRRWVPSTMANIFDLLADSKRTVQVNDNISTLYIVYQCMLMMGTILGPGTIFLMMIGAINAITGMSNMHALLFNLVPVLTFLVVCMTCKSETQLMLANLITCFYAMVMMFVIVSIVLQISQDGWLAPSSMFTAATFGIFFVTAALHPQEIICLLYISIYYITIPSMYMLLIIYSLCNLNNVSWGTREVAQKKTAKEMEMDKKAAEEAKKKMDNQSIMKWFGKSDETSGSLEFSVAGLFRCMCCTNPKDHKDDLHLLQIANSIEKIEKRLSALGAEESEPAQAQTRRRSSLGLRRDSLATMPEYADSELSGDIPREERDDLINPYWVEDPNLQKGEVDFLTTAEIEFWKDLIDVYLRPIDENKEEQERIKTDLKNLRDTMVFAFAMLNSLFVLVIFLLQFNQDQLHIKWPFGQDVALSYDKERNVVLVEQEFLMLEPIGSLFLVFFGFVMLIQFVAMLSHRSYTITHLLSTTELHWYFSRRPDQMSDENLLERKVVEIARELQKLNTDDLDRRAVETNDVSRRKTLHNLEKARDTKHSVMNLDANFKRRLTILQSGDPNVISRLSSLGGDEVTRRATIRALKTRRDSLLAEKRRSQLQAAGDATGYMYNLSGTAVNDMSGRASTASAYINKGYEPAFDSDDDEPPRPRRSTVRFRENYT